MPFTIRRLQPADAPAYRQFRLACLAQYPASFGSSAEEEGQQEQLAFEQHILTSNPDAFMIGAFEDATLVGICGFVRATRQKVRHQGDIRQVCVSPNHSERGIGRALMAETLRIAFDLPGLEQISLGVIANNTTAAYLYESLGFVENGFQKQYLKIDNQYFDHRLMVLFRSDYLATL
ncbi:GNAT family N-acetyltransferase [Hymenobacter pini]|uniref:GNAT family N-acetyltransferase n=1 Tax=Hymenobacter pini TaxID=2880879 RepID=UPI001CF5DE4E|nr:GNAT family protein [Hymenobacter pini]MCA8832058.1 GNAT family N-acetyltransferase [Hymenobacter pini]